MFLSFRFHNPSAAGRRRGPRHPAGPARSALSRGRPALLFFFFLALAACGGAAGDPHGPQVAGTNPAAGATAVPLSSPIQATFSSQVDPVTVNGDTFIVTGVSGDVTYQDRKAVFTPSAPLADGTIYHAVLTTGIKDLDGVPLASNYIWSFTAGSGSGGTGGDQTPPKVVSTSPQDGETNVAVDAPIQAVFSESILPGSLRSDTFFIQGVPGEIRYDDATHTATLQPFTPLALQTQYQATVTTGVTDPAGNPLAAAQTWSFTTGQAEDRTPPTVVQRQPVGDNVPLESIVTVQFSKPINPATLAGHFILTARGSAVPGELRYDASSRTATLIPSSLKYDTSYTTILTQDIRDMSGNRLEQTSWTWRTVRRPR